MITCAFTGHGEVYNSNIRTLIDHAIEDILKKDTSFTFYSGDMGEFDRMCSSAVRNAKRQYPGLDIKLIAVFPYMMTKINIYKAQYERLYDEIIIPTELSEVHYKSAITARNRWMVDRSDSLLSYVYRDFGGAYATLKYARRMGKEIINLADIQRKKATQSSPP